MPRLSGATMSDRGWRWRGAGAGPCALLHQGSSRYGVSSGRVFLAAWGRAATAWADSPATCVDVTGHGRDRFLEDIDVSGTIGYVTTISPAVLQSDQLVPTARPHEHTWG